MLCDVFVFHGVHVPVIHGTSHVDHGERDTWFSISVLACGTLPIVLVFCLVAGRPLEPRYKLTELYFCFMYM